jgi:hypothetical protein
MVRRRSRVIRYDPANHLLTQLTQRGMPQGSVRVCLRQTLAGSRPRLETLGSGIVQQGQRIGAASERTSGNDAARLRA